MLDRALFRAHIERIKSDVSARHSLADIPKWICDNTYIRGQKYSFKDHEFQQYIIESEDVEVNVMKCSQIGLSEVMARWVMGVAYNFPAFSTIITFPFSGDANDFAKTRVDPFIKSSPLLKEAMASLDNKDIKQIRESLVYFRGTNGTTAAISIPADCIVSDEIDRSNPHILTQYTSRLTHSPYKWRRNFSTPTVKGYGIDLKMQGSRRMRNLCKCDKCNHWFVPKFFEHVKIPGFDNELRTLTKNTLAKTRYLEAQLLCPQCGREPNLYPKYREYVCENAGDSFEAKGIFVSPFDAPAIITPTSLLKAMVEYARMSEFINQNLGETSEEVSESLVLQDIVDATTTDDLRSATVHAFGADMGLICHIVISRLTLQGQWIVVHRERCNLAQFEDRRRALKHQYMCLVSVIDSQPYVDVVMRVQKTDKNAFGAVYVNSKLPEIYRVKMVDPDAEAGKLPIHTVQIMKDKALDELLGKFKAKEILIQAVSDQDLEEEFQKQLLDMKRVQVFDESQELTYAWIKSPSANDHFHNATLYSYIACRLRGTVSRNVTTAGVPLVAKAKVGQANREPSHLIPRKRVA